MDFDVGLEMRTRIVAIIGVVGVLGVSIFSVARMTSLKDVSVEDFREAVEASGSATLGYQTSSPSSLPAMIAIRFPGEESKDGIGYPDRTDVYTLASTHGGFDCLAHVRQHRVCFVSFGNGEPTKEFREFLVRAFPHLLIK